MTSTVTIEVPVAAEEAQGHQFSELISAALAGDREALDALLSLIERRVYLLAYRLVGDRTAAEDISQEVFLKICRRLDQYRGGTSFLGWVYRIVVNQVHDSRRAAGPLTLELQEEPERSGYDAEREQQLRRIEEAMRVLTDKERTALVLTEIEGFSSAEAARIVGCLSVTLRTRAAQARKKIRVALARYYPELREEK